MSAAAQSSGTFETAGVVDVCAAGSAGAVEAAEAIRFSGVSFSYDGHERVLHDVDLSIVPGEFVCIVGENGSGKSTFARLVNGLLQPDEGEVRVFGLPTHIEGATAVESANVLRAIRSSVGMVFQNPDESQVATIVEHEVAFGPENLGLPSEEIQSRVRRALDAVGLAGFGKRLAMELSGGQKQRVAIAGALAMEPRILVLDEATAMLDPTSRAAMMQLLRRLHAQGMTVVMVTHDANEVSYAQRVVEFSQGTVSADMLAADYAKLHAVGWRRKAEAKQAAVSPTDAGIVPAGRAIIDFQDVGFSYHAASGRRKNRHSSSALQIADVLQHVTFSVREGEFLGIAGAAGSGKSTLIMHMNGLLQPTEGVVFYRGEQLNGKSTVRRLCAQVGVVFQNPEQQLFAPTVAEDIAFGPRNLGLCDTDVQERVEAALDCVGLPLSFADRSPFELSGGEQRRVAIAGVLAMRPQVLVLDEPAASLDARGHDAVMRELERLHEAGTTIVLVSHDMDDLAAYADRVLMLCDGRITALGVPQDVLAQDAATRGAAVRGVVAQGVVEENELMQESPVGEILPGADAGNVGVVQGGGRVGNE